MRTGPLFQILILALLFLPACSTTTEQTATKRSSQYRTFAVAPLPNQGPESDPAAAVRLGEVARAAIVETLTAKGFTETIAAEADFIVKVQTEFQRDPVFENSERRHVTIAFHDSQSDEVVWSKQRGRSSSRTLEPELLRKSITEMLASVPSPSSR